MGNERVRDKWRVDERVGGGEKGHVAGWVRVERVCQGREGALCVVKGQN